jgi:hypothetical protein
MGAHQPFRVGRPRSGCVTKGPSGRWATWWRDHSNKQQSSHSQVEICVWLRPPSSQVADSERIPTPVLFCFLHFHFPFSVLTHCHLFCDGIPINSNLLPHIAAATTSLLLGHQQAIPSSPFCIETLLQLPSTTTVGTTLFPSDHLMTARLHHQAIVPLHSPHRLHPA